MSLQLWALFSVFQFLSNKALSGYIDETLEYPCQPRSGGAVYTYWTGMQALVVMFGFVCLPCQAHQWSSCVGESCPLIRDLLSNTPNCYVHWGRISNRSSGVRDMSSDICTRFGRYFYSMKCSWKIISSILLFNYRRGIKVVGAVLKCLILHGHSALVFPHRHIDSILRSYHSICYGSKKRS